MTLPKRLLFLHLQRCLVNTAVTTDSLKNLVDNIIANINSFRDDFNSLNNLVIKRLQEDNIWLRVKCDCLEKNVDLLQNRLIIYDNTIEETILFCLVY